MKLKGKGIFAFKWISMIRIVFIIIALMSLFFNLYHVYQDNGKEIGPVIKELGSTMFDPFTKMEQATLKISEQGLFPKHEGFLDFFRSLGIFISNLYYFILPLINFYFTFYLLFLFSKYVLVQDSSRDVPAFIVASVMYFLLIIAYVGAFTEESLDTPFIVLKNTFKTLSNIFR